MAESQAGFSEAVLRVARHIGLDVASLRAKGSEAKVAGEVPVKFKKTRDTSPGVARGGPAPRDGAARLVAPGAPALRPFPRSAREIRESILGNGGVVDLDSLVRFCWATGLPVLHVSAPPKSEDAMY